MVYGTICFECTQPITIIRMGERSRAARTRENVCMTALSGGLLMVRRVYLYGKQLIYIPKYYRVCVWNEL